MRNKPKGMKLIQLF